MTYRDPEKQKEANRLKQARHRQKVTPSERDVTPSARPQAPDVTPRINPMNGKPYGTSMLGLLSYPKGAECLKEYEKWYNQTEPVYGEGNKYDFLAEYGTSEKFKRIVSSLGDLSGEVRIGAFGPTIQELADTLS